MKITKADRELVRLKFGGRCAYCGCDLPARWHVDHLEPVERKTQYVRGKGFRATGEMWRPENHRLDNLMPSCPSCNISKHSFSLESWRMLLAKHLDSLNSYHKIYRLVKTYGLVKETGKAIVFYFELGEICGNCECRLPDGCGGLFEKDGDVCLRTRKAESTAALALAGGEGG